MIDLRRKMTLSDGEYEYEVPVVNEAQLRTSFWKLPKRARKKVWRKAWSDHLGDLIISLLIVLTGALEMVLFPDEATTGLFFSMLGAGLAIYVSDMITYELHMLSKRKLKMLRKARARRKNMLHQQRQNVA